MTGRREPSLPLWLNPRREGRIGDRGEIAQLVEHSTENRGVPGSSPGLAIKKALQMGMFLR